jgi:dihydroorotate dehydrogenase electron transfer subunit
MKQFVTSVVSQTLLSDHVYALDFIWNSSVAVPLPGQFCTIRVSESTAPLLRRPFAFSQFSPVDGIASIIYKQCGPATDILAGKQPGDTLDVIAPLGNSFEPYISSHMNILVGGGTGLGPICFLQQHLASQSYPMQSILGFRSQAQIPALAYPHNTETVMCTEDGSTGFAGNTVAYLESLSSEYITGATLLCCGPSAMMKACHAFAVRNGLQCYVSLEQVMACGVGACMGCTVKISDPAGYARVCTDGPIFDSKIILWT